MGLIDNAHSKALEEAKVRETGYDVQLFGSSPHGRHLRFLWFRDSWNTDWQMLWLKWEDEWTNMQERMNQEPGENREDEWCEVSDREYELYRSFMTAKHSEALWINQQLFS